MKIISFLFVNDFAKKMKKLRVTWLFDLYIKFLLSFFVKVSVDLITFFLINPVKLIIYKLFFCAGFYSNNNHPFFGGLKLSFSFIIVEVVFFKLFYQNSVRST